MSVIVSLTTIASRATLARYVLLSLASQKRRPDRIVLNVSREGYLMDTGIPEDNLQMLSAEIPSLEIHWVANTGPYRKLCPTINQCGDDDLIVTADDDVIYDPDWLPAMLECAYGNPEAIVCGLARAPSYNLFGRRQGYRFWRYVAEGATGVGLVPIGIAGVVYRKRLLDIDWLLDPAAISIAPTTDDLWFAEAARRRKTRVIMAPGALSAIHSIANGASLFSANSAAKRRNLGLCGKLERFAKSWLGLPYCANDFAAARIEIHSRSLPA